MRRIDKVRPSKATYKEIDASKRRRKLLRAQRKQKGDQAQENEGVSYASGSSFHTMRQNCTCNLEYLKEGYYIENEKNSISFYSS